MKQGASYILIYIILIILISAGGCTYFMSENNNSTREYSTPSPLIVEEPDPDEASSLDTRTQEEEIPFRERGNNPPTADLSISPGGELYMGMNIFFDAGTSRDPDGDYLEYYWDFGDGSHPFGPTLYNPVCHTYLINGEYTIRLTVLDNYGGFSIKERRIHIRDF